MLSIAIRSLALRVTLLLGLAAALGWLGWINARAAIGDAISTYLARNPNLSNEARQQGVAQATGYAPRDPLVRWHSGGIYLALASEEQSGVFLPLALAELRTATRLSPADYRLWLALGRAAERGGMADEARAAFERAAQLAPNHFEAQWGLGNYLLRAGQREAAFAALRAALRTRPAALPLVFDYAWQAYDGDSRALSAALAETNEARGHLAALLLTRGRVAEALALWQQSGPHAAAETRRFITALSNNGQFKAAYDLWRASNDAALPQPDENSLLANGGFEQNFDPAAPLPLFSWRVQPGAGVAVTLDSHTRAAGQMSLRFRFELQANQALLLAAQTVPVKAGAHYCLSFVSKTDTLQSLSTPQIGIYDAAEEKRLSVLAPPWPNGTRDWSETVLRFTVPAATEAVTVRLQRLPCSEPPCPLTGRLWLDNFRLIECGK